MMATGGSRYDLEQNRMVPGTTSPEAPEPARTDDQHPVRLPDLNLLLDSEGGRQRLCKYGGIVGNGLRNLY